MAVVRKVAVIDHEQDLSVSLVMVDRQNQYQKQDLETLDGTAGGISRQHLYPSTP